MNRKCAVCKTQARDPFSLELKADDDQKYKVIVCGSCWDAIAGIARLAVISEIESLQNQINEMSAALETVYFRD